MDARELQKLRPVREVVELQEHFTIIIDNQFQILKLCDNVSNAQINFKKVEFEHFLLQFKQ